MSPLRRRMIEDRRSASSRQPDAYRHQQQARDHLIIRVEQGKGSKDPNVMLSPSLLDLLRTW